jgi:ketosteroid isomerase-like protein
MADNRKTAKAFLAAWTTGDLVGARKLLHDDLSFEGPIDTFDTADDYIGALKNLSAIVKAAETQKVFEDGNDVCVIYNLVTNTPAGTSPTVDWYHFRSGKISSIRVYFDARPFAALRGGQ